MGDAVMDIIEFGEGDWWNRLRYTKWYKDGGLHGNGVHEKVDVNIFTQSCVLDSHDAGLTMRIYFEIDGTKNYRFQKLFSYDELVGHQYKQTKIHNIMGFERTYRIPVFKEYQSDLWFSSSKALVMHLSHSDQLSICRYWWDRLVKMKWGVQRSERLV